MGREPVNAGTNESGRCAVAQRLITGMVAAGAVALCVPAAAFAKNDTHGDTPPGQAMKAASGQPPGQAKKTARAVNAPGAARKAVQPAQSPRQQRSAVHGGQPPGQAKKAGRSIAPRGQARKATARRTASAPPRRRARRAASPRAHASTAGSRRAATRVTRTRRTAAVRPRRRQAVATAPARKITTTSAAVPAHRVATKAAPRAKPHHGGGPVRVVTREVTTTVRDIAHVIPGWAKALMVALACLLAVAAAIILLGALRSRRLRAQRERLAADVGALQAALLPMVPAQVGPLAISVAYRPADGLAAGGDFYDVFPLDRGRIGILVGDVSGHGRESLPAATFTRHMVRAYLEAGLGARESLRVAGRVVDQHRGEEDFATLVAAVYDPTAGTFSYASAGHPPPIVLGAAAHEPMIVAAAPPLGVGSPTGLRQTTVPLPAGSTVCLFTDGLFEARKGAGTLGRARLTRIVSELGPNATASDLVHTVEQHTDAIRDDVAVCILRVGDDAVAAGTVRVEELEVEAGEADAPRVRRFLKGCRVAPGEIETVLSVARARASADVSVLLRVRLARGRSGVDVLPARATREAAAVAPLSPKLAVRG